MIAPVDAAARALALINGLERGMAEDLILKGIENGTVRIRGIVASWT